MKLLIAEHDAGRAAELNAWLQAQGHEVMRTGSCRGAQTLFKRHRPDLVLMDVRLPDLDGYACARRMAALAEDGLSHVLLTVARREDITLEQFISSGAVDFIDEPIEPTLLAAKLAGYERMRQVYRQLDRHRQRLHHEVKLAKHMFDRILDRSPKEIEAFKHWILAAGHFSGDLLVYERTPDNAIHILMGDFTGHGLTAAVGALPTADVFFAMTRKGYGVAEIAAEINRKLHVLLPTGQFCAGILACLSPGDATLEVWSGGHPPLILLDAAQQVVGELHADKFPLGIVGDGEFDASTVRVDLAGVDTVLLCSDGLLEARNPAGEMFGERYLQSLMATHRTQDGLCLLERIKRGLVHFLDGLEPHDDVSVLTIDMRSVSRAA